MRKAAYAHESELIARLQCKCAYTLTRAHSVGSDYFYYHSDEREADEIITAI